MFLPCLIVLLHHHCSEIISVNEMSLWDFLFILIYSVKNFFGMGSFQIQGVFAEKMLYLWQC